MNPKQKIYIISGSILVLIALVVFRVIKPMIFEIGKISAMVSQSQDRLLLIESTDQTYFQQIESDYRQITDDLAIVKSGLIDNEQAVEFFMDLERIASLTYNNLEIDATNFPVLELTLIGNFPDLMKFLGWLEKGKYFLDVESFDSRQIGEREFLSGFSPGQVKTIVKIKVYTKK